MAERAVRDRSTAELVRDLADELRRLVRDELRLAADELRQKRRLAGTGAGLAGIAGVLALFGALTLVGAAVIALALVLPAWLSALVIGVLLLLAAGVAGLLGKRSVRAAAPPVPAEAAAGVAKDVKAVRGRG
jgi:uncharacterized membrane protein YqjE